VQRGLGKRKDSFGNICAGLGLRGDRMGENSTKGEEGISDKEKSKKSKGPKPDRGNLGKTYRRGASSGTRGVM